MTAARRWWIVGVGVLLLVASPMLVRALPVSDEHVGATTLLHRIQASRNTPFTAYGETAGNVKLPDNNALSGVTKLLAQTNKVRVWWRDHLTWRIATLRTTGETDLFHRGDQTIRWVYESKNATRSPDVAIRLPQTPDLLPNELAHRVLSGAHGDEVSRLPARRIAGRDTLGLRLTPADPQASVGRVDMYVDRATSVPLRVEVYAKGGSTPAVVSRYLDFSPARPPERVLAFRPPPDAHTNSERIVDIAAAANEFAERVPPKTLAGCPSGRVSTSARSASARGGSVSAVGDPGADRDPDLAAPRAGRSAPTCSSNRVSPTSTRACCCATTAPAAARPGRSRKPHHSFVAGTVTKAAMVAAANQLARHPQAPRAGP